MGWKEWPSWLKGGIIGLILFILVYFVFYGTYALSNNNPGVEPQASLWEAIFFIVGSLISYPIFFIAGIFDGPYRLGKYHEMFFSSGLSLFQIPNFLGWIILFFIYLLIGIIIGWLIGKIKQKNIQEQNLN